MDRTIVDSGKTLEQIKQLVKTGETVRLDNSVFARGKGIQIIFYYKGARIKELMHLALTITNIDLAIKTLLSVRREIELTGELDYKKFFPTGKNGHKFGMKGNRVTLKKALTDWLDKQKDSIEHTTYEDYEKSVKNRLVPVLGGILLTELSVGNLQDWVDAQSCSAKRIRNVLCPIRAVLDDAYLKGEIKENPLNRVRLPKKKPRQNTIDPETGDEASDENEVVDPFQFSEIKAILAACIGCPPFSLFVVLAFSTGMRTSELIALKWRDIDFKSDVIKVRRAYVRKQYKVTKTISGRRDIKMLKPAREALLALKALTYKNQDSPVLLNPKSLEMWTGDKQIRESFWRPALERAGVRYRYPYQTRHTYASTLLSSGENPMWVADQMGHKDWAEIRRTYGRWIPDTEHREGTLIEAMWKSKLPNRLKAAS